MGIHRKLGLSLLATVHKTVLGHLLISRRLLSLFWVQLRKNCALTRAASIPSLRQSENTGPRLFGFFFGSCPHLEYLLFLQFFELNTKAAFAKAAGFDNLRLLDFSGVWGTFPSFSRENSKKIRQNLVNLSGF